MENIKESLGEMSSATELQDFYDKTSTHMSNFTCLEEESINGIKQQYQLSHVPGRSFPLCHQ